MNRGYKFRGKTPIRGEWAYGSLVYHPESHVAPDIFGWDGRAYFAVDPRTIGQFTGYRDKNGTEVYEGDIVKWQQAAGGILPPDTKPYICTIEWSQFMAGWSCKHANSTSRFTFASSHMEVMGNIYQNEDLLETKS